MTARLTLDERAELERLRRLTEEQQEELRAYRETLYTPPPRYPHLQERYGLRPAGALILAELIERFPQPVSKERLLTATAPCWLDRNHEPELQSVAVQMSAIRKRLNECGLPGAIKNIRGFGFVLTSEAAAVLCPQKTEIAA